MKEATVLTVLLILQQRYSSIREIITDAGTNLHNLTDKGKCTLTGNDQHLLTMLQRVYNAHPLGQRSNLAEYNIKRFKFLLKTFNKGKFLEKVMLLSPLELELCISYLKNIFESVPYFPYSDLCPKFVRGHSICLPYELYTESTKFKFWNETQVYIMATLNYFITELQHSDLAQNNFYYSLKKSNKGLPKVNDICSIIKANILNTDSEKVKLGIVKSVGKTSAEVRFANGHVATYPFESIALLCRGPIGDTDTLVQ